MIGVGLLSFLLVALAALARARWPRAAAPEPASAPPTLPPAPPALRATRIQRSGQQVVLTAAHETLWRLVAAHQPCALTPAQLLACWPGPPPVPRYLKLCKAELVRAGWLQVTAAGLTALQEATPPDSDEITPTITPPAAEDHPPPVIEDHPPHDHDHPPPVIEDHPPHDLVVGHPAPDPEDRAPIRNTIRSGPGQVQLPLHGQEPPLPPRPPGLVTRAYCDALRACGAFVPLSACKLTEDQAAAVGGIRERVRAGPGRQVAGFLFPTWQAFRQALEGPRMVLCSVPPEENEALERERQRARELLDQAAADSQRPKERLPEEEVKGFLAQLRAVSGAGGVSDG